MKTQHAVVLDALIRIQRFLDANSGALGPVNSSGARRTLDDVVARLTDHAAAQVSHATRATGETHRLEVLRDHLRRSMMQPIVDMARTKLPDIAELATLRVPRGNITGVRFIAQASALADTIAPYEATLVEGGLKTDFLQSLRTGIADLSDSENSRRDSQRGRGSATIGLGAEASTARKAIRMLNAAIMQQIAANAELVAEWKSVKRIPKKPGTARDVAPSTPATPVATAAPATPAPVAA
jgi:hypothetical protein